ncbi:hypothetical protein HO173_013341 [Letharia columbiana]|uniref:Uncharacterized protein n=1 Tax=Letharia columbiana TaxID=112416 RepID=A0A8H6FCH9_9LECA|nr:uncharacterized protein HO173_013341 [Letharia columbiana]KAF6223071.1 hypothetical protein HO173_013341 [Letharia columbiana]
MRVVMEFSKPEFDPIHAILSPATGAAEIPTLLRGEKPSSSDPDAADLGTHSYSKKPVAIMMGGAYGEEDAKAMREACKGHLNVPWIFFDKEKPIGLEPGPEYAKIVIGRGKELVKKLEEEDKFGKDGIYYY